MIHAVINDSRIFSRKLRISRLICCKKRESVLSVTDEITNCGDLITPLMLLYHVNVGYPLLSENSVVDIHSDSVTPRNDHAWEGLSEWSKMLPPTKGFEEQCYFHHFDGQGYASIYNSDIGVGLELGFNASELDNLTEWKMMGIHDYVLGLEPGNCTPIGRRSARENGTLRFIEPNETKRFHINVSFFER